MTERLRDVRLANARGPEQQHVLSLFDEAAGGKIDDLGHARPSHDIR